MDSTPIRSCRFKMLTVVGETDTTSGRVHYTTTNLFRDRIWNDRLAENLKYFPRQSGMNRLALSRSSLCHLPVIGLSCGFAGRRHHSVTRPSSIRSSSPEFRSGVRHCLICHVGLHAYVIMASSPIVLHANK